MSVLKAILLAMVPTLITGVLLGLFTARLNAPENAIIEVKYQYVKVPNPFFVLPARAYIDIDALYLKLGFTPPLSEILEKFRQSSELWIITGELTNNSELRSKPVELSTPGTAVWRVGGRSGTSPRTFATPNVTLDPLAPSESVQILAIVDQIYLPAPTLVALHDGRRVETQRMNMDIRDDVFGFATTALKYPGFITMFVFAGSSAILILILIMVLGIIGSFNVPFRAKITSPQEAKKLAELLEYIRANDPKKLA